MNQSPDSEPWSPYQVSVRVGGEWRVVCVQNPDAFGKPWRDVTLADVADLLTAHGIDVDKVDRCYVGWPPKAPETAWNPGEDRPT